MAMKNIIVKCLMLALCFGIIGNVADAQAKKKATRTVKKRTTAKRTTNSKTKANINPSAKVDTAVVIAPPKVDSLPIQVVKKSLRPNDAIERNLVKDRTPLLHTKICVKMMRFTVKKCGGKLIPVKK